VPLLHLANCCQNDKENRSRDNEIKGLNASNKRRSCESHEFCWENLSADEFNRFRLCVDFEDGPAEAIRAVQSQDGTASCVVGFYPRNIVKRRKDKFIKKVAQVFQSYEYSANRNKVRNSS
jgi:hypothetical protein